MNEPAQSPSILWIEIEDRLRVVAVPHQGPQTRQVLLSSSGWRRFDLSLVSQGISIGRSGEAVEPCGSFFGLDPVENGHRHRDPSYEIVTRHLVAGAKDIKGDQ